MVELKVLRSVDFEAPYEYCREEVVYVRCLYALIRACEAGALHHIDQAPSIYWVLFIRDIHLVARREILERDNNFTFRVRA